MIKVVEEKFTITNKTKGKIPKLPFVSMKNKTLGKNYCLSLVFIGESRSKKLNLAYRGKNKATNVLSFPSDKKNGEIFITPSIVKRQTKLFGRKFENLVALLFIHGLMHLKGMKHGSTMERAEKKLRKQFRI